MILNNQITVEIATLPLKKMVASYVICGIILNGWCFSYIPILYGFR